MTDDQRFDDLAYMPNLDALVRQRGVEFNAAYVSNSLCCPSRASMLTGRYSHGTGVYTNYADGGYGAWAAFRDDEVDTVATRLQGAGYSTGLFGKYLNAYEGSVVPPGWDRWAAFADTGNPGGAYYSYALALDDGSQEVHNADPEDYSTDVLGQKVVDFIASTPIEQPLFAWFSPFAPHGPNTPAPRHVGTLGTATIPSYPSLDQIPSDPPPYLLARPSATPTQLRTMVARRRTRLETLLAVDEQVGAIIGALEQSGRLENTLVIFVSDNGKAQWEHRWTDKIAPYVESARIPLLMRWDAVIPANVKRSRLAANIDIPATILEAAGIPDLTLDGKSLLPAAVSNTIVRGGLLLEHVKFRDGDPETFCGWQTPRYLYVRDVTGFEELYDQQSDPWQLVNLAPSKVPPLSGMRARTRAACVPLPPGMSAF